MSAQINHDRAEDEGDISAPGFHPDDPEGTDDWRLGFCDYWCSGKGAQLVRPKKCIDPDCIGCLGICLKCEGAHDGP